MEADTKFFILTSTVTGKPYIDKKNAAHGYLSREAAEKADFPGTIPYGPVEIKTMSQMAYLAGADGIYLHTSSTAEFLAIREQDLPIGFYNHVSCQAVTRIKEFQREMDLYQIVLSEFLMPAKVVTEDGEIHVTYAAVKRKTADPHDPENMLYLAFTTINEYNAWADKHPGWRPLRIAYDRLLPIIGSYGLLINPEDNRLIVSPAMFRKIQKKDK